MSKIWRSCHWDWLRSPKIVASDQGHKVWETLIRMTYPVRSCLAGSASQDRRIAGLVCAKKSVSVQSLVLEWFLKCVGFLNMWF